MSAREPSAASSPEFGTSGTGKSERTEPGAAREPLPEACACESCQDAAWPQAKGHDAAREPLPEACACESCQDAAWPQAKGHDAASTPFRDALDKIDGAFALHYSTGDYGPLGMALQDNETEVMRALRLAVAMEEMLRG